MENRCEGCAFYEHPDYGMPKECTFPWLGDWTKEEKDLMKCQDNEEEENR